MDLKREPHEGGAIAEEGTIATHILGTTWHFSFGSHNRQHTMPRSLIALRCE